MKKWFLGIILAVGLISIGAVAPTFAAGGTADSPFNGVFTGTAFADYHSSAPLILEMTQDGEEVTAVITIDEGLRVNAGGFCGVLDVPAGSITASGVDTDDAPDILAAQVPFDVGSGVTITADITGEMDGDDMDVTIKINTPFICSNDPIITGSLTAQ
jgi:hypothetical protein